MLKTILTAAAPIIAGLFGKKSKKKASTQSYDYQKEFARHGIRWKVEDAKAAGLHPLAALGANTLSFNPSQIGDSSDIWSNMGQNLQYALSRMKTKEEKAAQLLKLKQEQKVLENMGLQNTLLRKQINDITSGPPMPSVQVPPGQIPGQPDAAPGTVNVPVEVPYSSSLGYHAGTPPAEINNIMPGGWVLRGPGDILSEALEGSFVIAAQYGAVRVTQYLRGLFNSLYNKDKKSAANFLRTIMPREKLPPNHYYVYYPLLGMFRVVKDAKRKLKGRHAGTRKFRGVSGKW